MTKRPAAFFIDFCGASFELRRRRRKSFIYRTTGIILTHNLTHNRKRASGDNGADSTVAAIFPEQKGPESAKKRHSKGWQSVGKDEVGSSNLPSSSRKAPEIA